MQINRLVVLSFGIKMDFDVLDIFLQCQWHWIL